MFLRAFLVLLALVPLSSCDVLSGARSYRYRVTVEVDTPAGVRTGSSVWEVKSSEGGGPDRKLITTIRGEAVPVDISGGTLFALMRAQDLNAPGEYAAGLVEGHFLRHPSPQLSITRDWAENMRRIIQAKPAFDLDPQEYPLLVSFRDQTDPGSVEQVLPNEVSDAFGSGAKLKRITVAVTNDRPSQHIDAILPWLRSHRGSLEHCPTFMPQSHLPLKCVILDRDFRRNT